MSQKSRSNGIGRINHHLKVLKSLPRNSVPTVPTYKYDPEGTRAQALELRKGGWSYSDIAKKMGVNIATVYNHVQSALIELREKTEMDAQSVRDLELERCDRMLQGLWPKAKKGDPAAVAAAIRVLERRSKMLGLDAPAKSEWVGALTGVTPETVAKMSEADIAQRVRVLMGKVANAQSLPDPSQDAMDIDAELGGKP